MVVPDTQGKKVEPLNAASAAHLILAEPGPSEVMPSGAPTGPSIDVTESVTRNPPEAAVASGSENPGPDAPTTCEICRRGSESKGFDVPYLPSSGDTLVHETADTRQFETPAIGPGQVPKLPPRPISDRSGCPNPLTCAKTDDGSAADDDDGAFLLPFEDVPEFAAIPTFVGRFPGMAFKSGPRGRLLPRRSWCAGEAAWWPDALVLAHDVVLLARVAAMTSPIRTHAMC